MYTSPRDTFNTPLIALSSVDFPAPFGPTMAVIFPARTVSEMSSMIGGPPYPAVSRSVLSTASGGSAMALVHPEVGVDHPGVVAQAGKRSLRDDLAQVHHDHLMAGSLDEREVVLDHDDGAALVRELPNGLADPGAEHGINASHRLVQDDQPGLGGGDAGKFEQPLLAAAESERELVPELGELEALKDSPHHRSFGFFMATDVARPGQGAPEGFIGEAAPPQHDVVHDGQVAPLARGLERADQPEPGDGVGTLADEWLAGERDGARVRPTESGHQVNHRALARAVRADQPDHLAFGDREGAIPHRVDAAEGLGQVLDLEQRGSHSPARLRAASEASPSFAAASSLLSPGVAASLWLAGGAGVAAVALAAPVSASTQRGRPACPGPVSSPGRSRKSPSGRNLRIRMIIRPIRTWRIAGPKSGRDAGDGRYLV